MTPRWAPRETGNLLICLAGALAAAASSCVPEGPATQSRSEATTLATKGPSTVLHTKTDPLLRAPFNDDFERSSLGPNWRTLSDAWAIKDGELCVRGARNRGAWLRRRLPTNARMTFDARSETTQGDIKVEVWGDGHSGATELSYQNATSYLAIWGGWNNRRHVLARIDEHGKDRLSLTVDKRSDDPRAKPVQAGQIYRFRIERQDDRTIKWWVDDELLFSMTDPEPLRGKGHDHFGFNDWLAPVCFDKLSIVPL